MEYRVGLCSSCGASFKVPASFSADRAKCKVCAGVVEVGPVQSDAGVAAAPPPIPTRKPTPRDPERAKPATSETRREGPTMKERLLAERRAAEAAAAATSKPSAIPADTAQRTVGGSSGGGTGQVRPAVGARDGSGAALGKVARNAAKPVAGAAARTTAAGASGTAKASSRPASAKPAGARDGSEEPKESQRQSASSRRRSGAAPEKEAGQGSKGRPGRGRAREKLSPALLVTAGALALVGLGAGAWLLFSESSPMDPSPARANPPGTLPTPGTPEGLRADGPGAPSGTTPEPTGQEAPAQAPPAVPAAPAAATPRARAQRDPASVDLNALAEFGPPAGTSGEEWARVRDLVATALDPESGIAGNRARLELEQLMKPAFPAIINRMRTLDYSTERGYRDGDIAQRMLQKITSGRNFEWRYTTEPGDEYFNKRVVESWHKVWARAQNDEAYWKDFARIPDGDGGDAGASGAGAGSGGPARRLDADDLDALDDL
jgi:hypothetical protein